MELATLKTERDFIICQIDPRIYGSFVEHMGRVVYGGIFQPEHPSSDLQGFRQDVLELVKNLDLSVIRYPGGNYTSSYHWEDAIGPIEQRPIRLNLAWKAIEHNTFGLNEFMQWIKKVGAEPIITLNLGTRGIDDARNMVEYCNFPGGTHWSELRRKHGVEQPYGVKLWCLGNELDGSWQLAAKTADEYGRLANETAKAIKWIDPSIETIAVGSSTPRMNSFPEWDRKVLMECYDNVDYLSLHNYINRMQEENLATPNGREPDDIATYLSRSLSFDRQIEQVISTCDFVAAVKRSNKKMYLAFDEWNVHRYSELPYEQWKTASPIDWCHFTMADTLVFCGMLLSILRHADRIKIACQSLLINTISLIMTGEDGAAWVNPIYYPMLQASQYGRGALLYSRMDCGSYENAVYSNVPYVDHVIIHNGNEITIFALNRAEREIILSIYLYGFNLERLLVHSILVSDNLDDTNTQKTPTRIVPLQDSRKTILDGDAIKSHLPPYSWNMIRVQLQTT
ncbi:MAG: alpha-N-arabinofuranosidase [Clostridiales bacterium]|jgi:alpha-N-arabinofuranosidase|nr:alpha-N-arabinofuranosidase [Clostridiales bacterium]